MAEAIDAHSGSWEQRMAQRAEVRLDAQREEADRIAEAARLAEEAEKRQEAATQIPEMCPEEPPCWRVVGPGEPYVGAWWEWPLVHVDCDHVHHVTDQPGPPMA